MILMTILRLYEIDKPVVLTSDRIDGWRVVLTQKFRLAHDSVYRDISG